MIKRADRLRQFRFQWADLNAALMASASRWLILILVLAGLARLVAGQLRARTRGAG
jgi:hypothetical protein